MSNKVLKYVILGGIFLIPFVPLVVTPSLFFPFITGKAFAFRILVQIIFACWLVLALRDREYRPKFSWILAGLSSFLIAIGLATIFAENPFKAFWSNFERMEGYITLLHVFAYFIVLGSVMKTQSLWNKLLTTSIGVSFIMAIYAFFQLAGKITINQGGVRVDGTLGNAGYLAIYVVFHIFFASLLYFRSKRVEQKIILATVALMNLIVLYYTATRGAILGLIGGAFVSFVFLLYKSVKGDSIRKVALGGLLAIIALVGIFVGLRNTEFVRESPVLSRFSSLSFSEIRSQGRYFVWPMAYKGFVERPIFGWGQEGFNFVFNKNYDARMYTQEPWFDRVHNTYLDWLIAGGLLGLITYLSVFASLVLYILRKNEEDLPKTDKAILLGLISAYAFNNFFVFDQLVSYIMFFLVLAYVHSHSVHNAVGWWEKMWSKCKNMFDNEKIHPIFESLIVVFFILVFYFVIVVPWKSNRDLLGVLKLNAMGQVGTLEDYSKPFRKYNVGFAESLEHISQSVIAIGSNPGVPNDIKIDTFDVVDSAFKKHIEKVPNDARYRLFYGMFLSRFGWYGRSLEQLEIAQKLSPQKQQIYFERISSLLMDNKPIEALALAKEVYELEPNYVESKLVYAFTASSVGQAEVANRLMLEIDINNLIFDNRYLTILINLNQIDKALEVVNARIQADPQNIQHQMTLTAVYLQANRRVEAINTLQRIIELEPSFKDQGEYYINEIRAGRNP